MRVDGGGGYTSNDFEALCVNQGVTNKVTALYTLHHNGLVERRNRTMKVRKTRGGVELC